ncbi:30S ribosomal protein S1 [candidate division WOR-3 bacterium]|nr:30S ribosomal protein S1 [candidate division WOR-3 bacterium]
MSEELSSVIEPISEEDATKLLDKSLKNESPGIGLVKGRIVKITDNEVLVNVGLKSEGIIPIDDFDAVSKFSVGDVIDVYLDDIGGNQGLATISKKKADFIKVWDHVKEAHKEDTSVECEVVRRVKGGFMVKVFGTEAFLPGSQIDLKPARDLDINVGDKFDVRIIKVNFKRRNIVVSRRVLLSEKQEARVKEFLEGIKEGDVVEGTVKNITEFGAFIELDGIDGLLHITDMSWRRIGHPSEMLSIGDTIKVKVKEVDEDTKRVSLGLKQLKPDPWKNVQERYQIGNQVKGKVVSLTDYGAFIELETGIEGLIHVSEMSWTKHIKHPSEVMKVGQEVEAIVLEVDEKARKISLGLRQAIPDPWENVEEKYPAGSMVKGKVVNLTSFGAFIQLEEGVEGLLHISDISWTQRINHPRDVLDKGKTVKCQVLSVDVGERRISLGLKQLKDDPLRIFAEKYPVDSNIIGTIFELLPRGVIVSLGKGLKGFVPFSHLAKKNIKKPEEGYSLGGKLKLKVIEIDVDRRNIVLSEREYLKEQKIKYEELQKKKGENGGSEEMMEEMGVVPEVLLDDEEKVPTVEEELVDIEEEYEEEEEGGPDFEEEEEEEEEVEEEPEVEEEEEEEEEEEKEEEEEIDEDEEEKEENDNEEEEPEVEEENE